jgi:hypothetical protein
MRTFPTISIIGVATSVLLACSASSGPSGEAFGDGNGSGGSATSGTGGVIPEGGTGGTVGGTGGTINISGSSNGGSGASECGVRDFTLERKPAEVLLVLDRSASMKDPPEMTTETMPKWDLIIPALVEVVEATGNSLSWGLKVFPEDGPDEGDPSCSAGSVTDTINVEIAEQNSAAVVAGINGTDDGGDGTPTGDAMKQAVAYLESRSGLNDFNRYILLATDGEPSCINVTATSAGTQDSTQARTYAVSAVSAAAAAGFKTFVVGVGTNKESAKLSLNDMAIAGGEPASCANPLDDCFYLGNDRVKLTTDLLGIAQGISSCVFELGETPPDSNNVRVLLDNNKVERDPTRTNGWEYQDAGLTIIEVYGDVCDAIKAADAADVAIRFGCPDVDVR